MKTAKNIYHLITARDNLTVAAHKAMKDKDNRAIREFKQNSETLLSDLQVLLEDGKYLPGKYREMYIYETKKRLIKIAPFTPTESYIMR